MQKYLSIQGLLLCACVSLYIAQLQRRIIAVAVFLFFCSTKKKTHRAIVFANEEEKNETKKIIPNGNGNCATII